MQDDNTGPLGCSHPRQRAVLDSLQEHVSMSIRDLAERLATQDTTDSITDLDPDHVDEIERTLVRRHVPELEERSYVHYDEHREVVSLLGHGPDVRIRALAQEDALVDLNQPERDSVAIDLSETTLERLHEAMRQHDGLDRWMSYDEVIWTLATDE